MQGYTEFRGAPWPPAGAVPAEPVTTTTASAPARVPAAPVEADRTAVVDAAPAATVAPASAAEPVAAHGPGQRMAGYTAFRGTPWPPRTTAAPVASAVPDVVPASALAAEEAPVAAAPAPAPEAAPVAPSVPTSSDAAASMTSPAREPGRRMAGYTAFRGIPWPPAAAEPMAVEPPVAPVPEAAPAAPAVTVEPVAQAVSAEPVTPAPAAAEAPAPAAEAPAPASDPAASGASAATAAATREAPPASSVPSPPASARTPRGEKDKPAPSLRRRLGVAVGGVVVLGLLAVLGARWLITVPAVAEFVARYPGVPVHPEATPVGIPAWLAWQHFLNAFLMVLIIRTGLQVRQETRPPANFTPTKPGLFAPPGSTGKKFSLTIWIHQALDALWLLNGLVFVVLVFATGHWMRLIPTDPATPMHMASTALQYATLDWPAHDGWVHYNALQMTAYAGVVFVLAPLAAVTGFRMSSWWPAENAGLNRAFPMELARRVHFPVMVLFVAFIVVHVTLTLLSGVLHNLNTMFLARDAADAWGLVAFLGACAVTAAAWVLLKPAIVSPVAERFGRVGR